MHLHSHRDHSPPKIARTDKLQKVFLKYASIEREGEYYMTGEDFVRRFLQPYHDNQFDEESVRLLTGIVDTDKDGLISFSEFQKFEALLCRADAPYKAAFQLFDRNGNGRISYEEFTDVVKKTDLYRKIPFKLDGSFARRYFGHDFQRKNSYPEFTVLIHDFIDEYATQVFRRKDPLDNGYISPADFRDIVVAVKGHALTDEVKDSLSYITGGQKVSYCFFKGFLSLLSKIDMVKAIYLGITGGDRNRPVKKEEMLRATKIVDSVIPLEIGILFQLNMYISRGSPETITYSDLENIVPAPFDKDRRTIQNMIARLLRSCPKFLLAFSASSVGAVVLYPIDLVKTRMQNQRSGLANEKAIYRHSINCFMVALKREGLLGLYRGLLPQLLAIGPEKAIKLYLHDQVHAHFSDRNGYLNPLTEALASACSGTAQLLITNPLEVVKIRMQLAGEVSQKLGLVGAFKQVGFAGLYRGSMACLLRDMLFTGIYFPAYSFLKRQFGKKDGTNDAWSLMAAGVLSAVPAASLATPADVIKTRLQVLPRKGETSYRGIIDVARKIAKEEGYHAFWKGTIARVVRSAPHLGITLMMYELLHMALQTTAMSELNKNPDHIGGYKVLVPTISCIESNFGLYLPRYEKTKPPDM